VLLSRESEELPDAYFDALEGVLLAPGWVMATLPVQLQHQVQLCAKQRLVRLLTPVAKLAAHRMKRQALKEHLLAGRGTHGLPGPQQLMAASPDLFALWPEASVAELCRTAKVRAYMPHSWVSPPPRSRHQLASSFNDLNGRISPPDRTVRGHFGETQYDVHMGRDESARCVLLRRRAHAAELRLLLLAGGRSC
jgi:hypothetical protein